MNKELIVYRGTSGQVHCMEAYCQHMGSHLKEGKVIGDNIECMFHRWQYNGKGQCVSIPCQEEVPTNIKAKNWPVTEAYGLIWIYTGEQPQYAVPKPPELEEQPISFYLGNRFTKNCHPHVMLINAIDEQHFQSVHPMVKEIAGGINFKVSEINESNLQFQNSNPIPKSKWYTRLLGKFYKTRATYDLFYWYGSTGLVTLGPDFIHLYLLFALRPDNNGKTKGHTLAITKYRKGIWGWIFNFFLLRITWIAGMYFARGDSKIFRSIKFDLKHPIEADRSIIKFIQHLEKQKVSESFYLHSRMKSNIVTLPSSKQKDTQSLKKDIQ